MKNYYYIEDNTISTERRLVDNPNWLKSRYVKLIEIIKAENYADALEQIKRKEA